MLCVCYIVLQTVARSPEKDSREMVVSIPMPGRRNAKGIDLSVSATELVLEGVQGFEPLRAKLPAVVDTQDVRAKFDKSKETLRVTLRVVSEHAGWQQQVEAGEGEGRKKDATRSAHAGAGAGSATAAGSEQHREMPTTTASDFAALGALLGGGGGGGGFG